ncbi:hypothetical protein EOA86_37045, partial [Mesorhizobium sp. M5C.F.Ca.IN.020.32.2.1]
TGLRSSTAIPAARHTSHAGAHSYSAGDATSGSEEAARFKARREPTGLSQVGSGLRRSKATARGAPRGAGVFRRFSGRNTAAQADMANGLALLLGIWMSISSVDIVSPRSIETCR